MQCGRITTEERANQEYPFLCAKRQGSDVHGALFTPPVLSSLEVRLAFQLMRGIWNICLTYNLIAAILRFLLAATGVLQGVAGMGGRGVGRGLSGAGVLPRERQRESLKPQTSKTGRSYCLDGIWLGSSAEELSSFSLHLAARCISCSNKQRRPSPPACSMQRHWQQETKIAPVPLSHLLARQSPLSSVNKAESSFSKYPKKAMGVGAFIRRSRT